MWCLLWTTVGTVGRVSMVSTMGTVGRVSTVGTVGSALSVDDAGHHGGALRGGGGEDGAGVPVRALLLVAELVVVGAEPPATVAARVGLLPWTPALVWKRTRRRRRRRRASPLDTGVSALPVPVTQCSAAEQCYLCGFSCVGSRLTDHIVSFHKWGTPCAPLDSPYLYGYIHIYLLI